MQKIKVKIKRTGDPVKKVVKKVDSKKEEIMGVKPGEKDLPEVKVTGNRPDLNKVTISSDEYKSKKWNYALKKHGKSPVDLEKEGSVTTRDVNDNYHESEGAYKKMPGAVGKVNVRYSDGTVKKLGEKYTPSYNPKKAGPEGEPEVDYEKLGGKNYYKEWYNSKYGEKK